LQPLMRQSTFNAVEKAAKQKKQQQNEQEIKPFHNGFGRDEVPFGKPESSSLKYKFELIPKTRTYRFRNLPYNTMAQKFAEY